MQTTANFLIFEILKVLKDIKVKQFLDLGLFSTIS